MKILLGVAALLSSTVALADSLWVQVGTSSEDELVTFDGQSIKMEGDEVTFWDRFVGPKVVHMTQKRVNCKSNTFIVLYMVERTRSGKVLSSQREVRRRTRLQASKRAEYSLRPRQATLAQSSEQTKPSSLIFRTCTCVLAFRYPSQMKRSAVGSL